MKPEHCVAIIAFASLGCRGLAPAPTLEMTIVDPGFERGEFADSPVEGWYSDDARNGRLTASADTDRRIEGERSLRVELLEPRAEGWGRASVSQAIAIDPPARGELEVSLALCAAADLAIRIELCEWREGVAHVLARRDLAIGPRWTVSTLRFRVARDCDRIGAFVYLPNAPGARVWLDDARVRVVGH